ncbi:MAG: hypothetical protein ACXQTE_06155 [Methanosarcinaceae archaeon]
MRILSEGSKQSRVADNNVYGGLYIDSSALITNNSFYCPDKLVLTIRLEQSRLVFRNNQFIGKILYFDFEKQRYVVDARYNYWGTTNRSEIIYKWHLDYQDINVSIEPYLDANGTVYEEPPPEDGNDGSEIPMMAFVALGILTGLLVILLLIMLVVLTRRRKPVNPEEPTQVKPLD